MSTPLSKRGYLNYALKKSQHKVCSREEDKLFQTKNNTYCTSWYRVIKVDYTLALSPARKRNKFVWYSKWDWFCKNFFKKTQKRPKLGISRYVSYLELLLTISVLNRLRGVTSLPKSSKTYKRNNKKTITVKTLKISLRY